jgi:hypothetical protein
MSRILLAAGLAGLLCACTSMPDWGWLPGRSDPVLAAGEKQYDFRWRLSGDRAVAPLQVFDDGRRTWLQFAPGQAVPAIFRGGVRGDQPLDYRRAGPYVVLDGVWPKLVLRGGGLRGVVERAAGSDAQASAPAKAALVPPGATARQAAAIPVRPTIAAVKAPAAAATLAKPRPGPAAAPAPVTLAGPIAPSYEVGPRDGNLRQALARWARSAGWTFEPEHWAVDADIPITGSARFGSGFKRSVQDLVASTELSEKPLQPCFYSNKVLRIVPYAQACDRSVDPARVS